jgi:hypothetical protein
MLRSNTQALQGGDSKNWGSLRVILRRHKEVIGRIGGMQPCHVVLWLSGAFAVIGKRLGPPHGSPAPRLMYQRGMR